MFLITFVIISIIDLLVIIIFEKINKKLQKENNVHFGSALPFSIFLVVVILYITGFLNNLLIGLYFICFIVFLFVVYIIKLGFMKDEKSKKITLILKQEILSPSFVTLLILFIAIQIYNKNASFTWWDEWSHWGPYVKDMFTRNKFYNTVGHIATVHLSYPPFIPLWEWFYIKTAGNICSMQNIYRGYQILCFSFAISLFNDLSFVKKQKINNTTQHNYIFNNIKVIFICIFAVLYFIFAVRIIDMQSNPIKSIYGDAFLGISFGFFMVNILQYEFDDIFKNINLILCATMLLFSKQMGMALFLLGIFILFIITLVNKSLTKQNFIKGLILFIIPLLFYASWKIEVLSNSVQDQFDSMIKLNELFEILFLNGGVEWQKTVKTNYINWIFNNYIIYMNAIMWGILFLLIFVVVSYLQKEKYGKKIFITSIFLIIGYAFYLFGLFCLYLKNFGDYEGVRLASIWRYVSTYLVGLLIYIGYVFIDWVLYKKKMNLKRVFLLFLVVTLLFISIVNARYVNYHPTIVENSDDYIYKQDFEKVQKLPENAKLIIVAQSDQGIMGAKFKFKFFDKEIASGSFGEPIYYVPDAWTRNFTKDEFLEYIEKFDYIYFYYTDENFWSRYGEIFNIKPDDKGEIYKISEILN